MTLKLSDQYSSDRDRPKTLLVTAKSSSMTGCSSESYNLSTVQRQVMPERIGIQAENFTGGYICFLVCSWEVSDE